MLSVSALNDSMKGLLPEHLGVRLLEADPERVVGELVVADHHCTTPGVLHGGVVMALADTLGAYATAIQLPPGARTTTLESKTNFLAATRVGETLRGEARPLHRGRRTLVWQTSLSAAGRLVAVVTQTQIVIPATPPAEEQLAALFRNETPEDAKALLVRLERAAAAIYEDLAEAESDPAERELLRANARREHENADALER